ncbi:MAG: hypothetical protein ABR564_03170 [Candidatus Dormibacteria bacterium]
MPGRIRPEASVPCTGPFDAHGWYFSVDWSGSRALLFASPDGSIRLQGERLDDLTGRFPEIAGAGAALCGRSAVLDGVIALLDPEGRPDLAALGHRLAGGLAQEPVAVFLATDLLHLDGAPCISWPLERRLRALAGVLAPDARVQLTEPVQGEGGALAEAASQRGINALLARTGSAPYRPGVASPDRLRIDLAPQSNCVLVGMARLSQGWEERRLLVAEHHAGHLRISATVSAALEPAVAAWVDRMAAVDLAQPEPAVAVDSDGAIGMRWLRPHLVVTVSHAGRHGDGMLVEPRLLAVRDDIDPLWCRRRPAVEPPGSVARVSRFRPTVLTALPMHP